MALLEVKNLVIELALGTAPVRVVDDVSFSLEAGSCLGIVGESGAGKTMTALAIMGLLPQGVARIASGSITFAGREISRMEESAMRSLRGNAMAMIFQEPASALNPVFTIGGQIAEVLQTHRGMARAAAWDEAAILLDRVGIADAAGRRADYPHELSGGQKQRVLIAMALACRPRLLIADEPTSALDAGLRGRMADLLTGLRREMDMAMLLITHDMAAVAHMAARIMVMYAGRKCEEGASRDVLRHPRHPYTKGLIASVPGLARGSAGEGDMLHEIPGNPPVLEMFGGNACLFAPRCGMADTACRASRPPEINLGGRGRGRDAAHVSACHYAGKV